MIMPAHHDNVIIFWSLMAWWKLFSNPFSQSKSFSIDSVSFLLNETEKSIELVSSFMFTPHACHTNQLVTINRFNKITMRWSNSDFYPKKYQNLHKCVLSVGSLRTTRDYIEGKIVAALAMSQNFEIKIFILMEQFDANKLEFAEQLGDFRNISAAAQLIQFDHQYLWNYIFISLIFKSLSLRSVW